MQTIVVTGGGGFIGSHTCILLLEKGYRVCVIDSFKNSSPKALERVSIIYKQKNMSSTFNLITFKGDICDKKFLENVFSEIIKNFKKIDGIIHFAGLKAVSESIYDPISYWNNNVLGTINLVDILHKFSIYNLVFSSSATVYKQTNKMHTEASLMQPINPYGNTKLTIEILLEDIYKSLKNNFKLASLRYFNPIGAHKSGLIGENPNGMPNNIFPLIINVAFRQQKKLEIFGNDWPTKDGTPVRDYIHVMDLAEAHIKILEYLFKKESTYLKINIGTGIATTVLDLIKTFEKVNKVKVPYVFSKRRDGDACYVVADNSLLISKFKFKLNRNIEDMCKDGWNWKNLNPNGF